MGLAAVRPDLVELDLAAPEEGADTLRHDPTFEAWDASVSGLRDIVNLGIDALNQLGAGLPRLPDGSLRELLVEPLTGDCGVIRANATACGQVRDALATVAGNQVRLVTWADPVWGGQAMAAWATQVGGRALATRTLGELIARAAPVLSEIADFCERLTVEVEGLVVELGERIQRLVVKLLSRVSGPLGWGALAADVAIRGYGVIADLIDDVTRVVDIVERLLSMHEEVLGWAQEQRDRLESLLDLPEVLAAIA